MSPPWSKPLDIDRLADGEADIDFAVPLAELPRLRTQVANIGGEVRGRVHFARESGFVIAELTLSGTATLTCQRCLEALIEPVQSSARVALITAESDATRVPEHLEPVLAAGGRVTVGELVEEELLLALPIVPLHGEKSGCGAATAGPDPQELQTTQRPFEGLGELFKR
jgi:uncharacterized protein